MANLETVIAEAGQRLGLSSRSGNQIVFGEKAGFLVQVSIGKDEDGKSCILEILRHGDPKQDEAVRTSIEKSPLISERKIKTGDIQIDDGVVLFTRTAGLLSKLNTEGVCGDVEALLDAVKSAAPPFGNRCRLCGGDPGRQPILLNSLVDRICQRCLDKIQQEAREAQAAYEALPLHLTRAVITGGLLAILGGAVWAGVTVATDKMFWAIAIGVGAVVGWGTTKAAGKGGLAVQVMGALLTLLGVLLGQTLISAHSIRQAAMKEGLVVDWARFIAAIPEILVAGGTDTLFALGGGIVGALYAIAKTGKPKFDISVEK